MALINMRDLIYHAYDNSYAIGTFNVGNFDYLNAIVSAAEKTRSPVILSISEETATQSSFISLMPAIENAAKCSTVPIAIQFDKCTNLNNAIKAINHGCNGLMFDAGNVSLPEKIALTKTVTEMAHSCGVPIIGEQVSFYDKNEKLQPHLTATHNLTSPAEAKVYVERTDVNFLTVSVGTIQGRSKNRTKFDFPRLKQLKQSVNIPLVIEVGSEVSEEQFRRLTHNGVSKIDYSDGLIEIVNKTMQQQIKSDKEINYVKLNSEIAKSIENEVERCLKLWGSAGRAAEILTQCQPWAPVEHLIIYNVEKLDEWEITAMVNEGRRVLSEIPGVRNVFSGDAIENSASYQLCWLIRFTDKAVIDSYRNHPSHVAFANKLFRPYAKNRISIDYQDSSAQNRSILEHAALHRLVKFGS